MRITIKVLKGDECEVEVSDATTILELKRRVELALKIPVGHQKLLCVGRTLIDDKTVGSYSPALKPGCKLTLVVKEPEPLKEVMLKLFRRYYTEDQSDMMTMALLADLDGRVQQMSLDDMERMAQYYVERDRQLNGAAAS